MGQMTEAQALQLKQKLYRRTISPPEIDPEACIGCEICVMACPGHVLAMQEDKAVVVNAERCITCGHCWSVCTEEAIGHDDFVNGKETEPRPEPAAELSETTLETTHVCQE